MSGERSACGAISMLLGVELGTCGQAPALLHIGACEHEHVRQRPLCEFHASVPEAAYCRTCAELPEPHAHECPVVLTLAAFAVDAAFGRAPTKGTTHGE